MQTNRENEIQSEHLCDRNMNWFSKSVKLRERIEKNWDDKFRFRSFRSILSLMKLIEIIKQN